MSTVPHYFTVVTGPYLDSCGVPNRGAKTTSSAIPLPTKPKVCHRLPESFSVLVGQRGHHPTTATTATMAATSSDTAGRSWILNLRQSIFQQLFGLIDSKISPRFSTVILNWSIKRIVAIVMNLKPSIETEAKNCGTNNLYELGGKIRFFLNSTFLKLSPVIIRAGMDQKISGIQPFRVVL